MNVNQTSMPIRNSLIKRLSKGNPKSTRIYLSLAQRKYLVQRGYESGRDYISDVNSVGSLSSKEIEYPVKPHQVYLIEDLSDFDCNRPLTRQALIKLLKADVCA